MRAEPPPDLVLRRLSRDPIDLAADARELSCMRVPRRSGNSRALRGARAGAAARRARSALSGPTVHWRTAPAAPEEGPSSVARRSRRDGPAGSSTLRVRSRREAFPGRSAARPAARERQERARLGHVTSPRLPKLARTPAVVGWVITTRRAQRASCSSSTAQTVFGSCTGERIPSCIRAPPEAVTHTSGVLRSTAVRQDQDEASRLRRSPSSRP